MPAQVDRDDGVPIVVGHVEQHPVPGDAGIVDDDVQAPEALGAPEQLVGGGALADVSGDCDSPGTDRGDLIEDVRGVQRLGHVVDDDGRTGARESDRLGTAETRGRAGHDGDASVQVQVGERQR